MLTESFEKSSDLIAEFPKEPRRKSFIEQTLAHGDQTFAFTGAAREKIQRILREH
jgi:hypothetical protein